MRTPILVLLALLSCSCATKPCPSVEFTSARAKISGNPYTALRRRGVIVITDVDDTIKNTHVMIDATRNRNLLNLAIDGLHSWRPVDGMADVYRHWHDTNHANFIYLSAGPRRYGPRLRRSLENWSFPGGSIVLRDEINPAPPADYKWRAISPILAKLSGRRFILVGDSGEYDPECYGELARQYRDQIAHIFIREISRETLDCPRYRCAFRDVTNKVTLFEQPSKIAKASR